MAAPAVAAVAGKAAKTIAKEAAKDPGKFGRFLIMIAIGCASGVVVICTLMSSLVSSFFGELLNMDAAKLYQATLTAQSCISTHMTNLMTEALTSKENIIEEKKVTTTYKVYAETFYSEVAVQNKANQLKEEYSQTPDLVECVVHTDTTIMYQYTIKGKTPDGREFREEQEFASEDDVEEYIAYKFQFGYQDLTRTKAKSIYYANFDIDVTICEIDFQEDWRNVPTSYVLAYQSTQSLDNDKICLPLMDAVEIADFLWTASPLMTIDLSEDAEKTVSFFNETKSPEELASIYWPEDEMKRDFFLDSQKAYADMLGERGYVYIDYDFIDIELYIHDYYQNHYKDVAYGNGTIASSGCGPTCMAMLATYYTGYVTTPSEVVAWCQNDYYVSGAGTSWSFFSAAAENYGFTCNNLGQDYQQVLDAIANGNPVIASMGPGTFTSSGHYILIIGMTSSGELIINDPNLNNVERYGTDTFDAGMVLGEAKNFWSFNR